MNNKQKSDEPSFNITLSEFLDSHLRTDFCAPINRKLGEIVEALSKDKLLCHVQWTDFEGKSLDTPMLWRYKYWAESSERYARAKAASDSERQRRFIFNRNLEIIAEAVEMTMLLDEARAKNVALSILTKNKTTMLQILDVKLIKNIDEV